MKFSALFINKATQKHAGLPNARGKTTIKKVQHIM